ncbi:lactadherin-like [Oculina patagonica]
MVPSGLHGEWNRKLFRSIQRGIRFVDLFDDVPRLEDCSVVLLPLIAAAATTPCTSNPCENGGVCTVKGIDSYICECTRQFYGDNCKEDCHEAFGMEDGRITDNQISASSELDSGHAAIQGRLHFQATSTKAGSWRATTTDANQWLQIDLSSQYNKITGVATQGRNGLNEHVRSYKLQYSNDGVTFQYYKEPGEVAEKVHLPNCKRHSVHY